MESNSAKNALAAALTRSATGTLTDVAFRLGVRALRYRDLYNRQRYAKCRSL